MKHKRLLILLTGLVVLCTGLQGNVFTDGNFRIEGDQPGYMLLDAVVVTFSQLSRQGKGDAAPLEEKLDDWMLQAKKAKAEGKIDDVFFKRYQRILVVIKLSIIFDPGGHLRALILDEINQFDIPKKFEGSTGGLAPVAGLLSEEILSLKRYLDKKFK
jgi:hypothetical protein